MEYEGLALRIATYIGGLDTDLPQNIVHSQSLDTVFPCDNCSKTFTSPLCLERHQTSCFMKEGTQLTEQADMSTDMTNLGWVYCPYCKYQTNRSDVIRRHLLIHSGVRPFKCDVCWKTFTRASHLTRHHLIHTGVKPFKCDVCGKSFTRASHLTRHHLIHTGVKPFKCDVCGKGFTRACHLNMHYRIHTEDKPYKCEECSYGCNRSSDLKRHVSSKHTGKR